MRHASMGLCEGARVIGRRRFIVAAAAGLIPAPMAWAQGPALHDIGFLGSGRAAEWAPFVTALRKGLALTGHAEGMNVAIHYRWAEERYERLPALAAELVVRPVAVIVASGGDVAARAAQRATASIPIVSTFGSDPVASGLVASLNRPGGNLTGVSLLSSDLEPKRVELVAQLLPGASIIALLVNPGNPNSARVAREVAAAAQVFRQRLQVVEFGGPDGFGEIFDRLAQAKVGAVLVASDPVAIARHDELVALAKRHAIPAIYYRREFVDAGGLLSYGPSFVDAYRLIGEYTGRILKGAKPTELPVQQSVKLEMIVNLKTAKALGLSIPDSVLLRADEVIE